MGIDVASSEWRNIKSNEQFATDKVEPQSFETEQALLGGILLYPNNLAAVSKIIASENDFYFESHKYIYASMISLSMGTTAHPVDFLSLKLDLEQKLLLSKVGGEGYLITIQSKSPNTSDLSSYAKIVADKAKCRRVLDACEKITKQIYYPNGQSTKEILDMAESEMFSINDTASAIGAGPRPISESIMEVVEDLKNNQSGDNNGVTGVSTGYTLLDQKTSGFQPGQLIIVAARPAMGKTTFAMNLIENIVLRGNTGKPALVFSLEMKSVEIASRLIAAMARVTNNNLKSGKLTVDDWKKIFVAIENFVNNKTNNIYIDEQSNLTPFDITSRARRIAKEHGGLSAIMVDYLQLMNAPGHGDNRANEVAECSKKLKGLAKELNVPVIALAQLNRGLEGRKEKRPMPSDLKESGSIEQDADIILFVHREEVYNANDPELKGKAEIIIGKNRSGETGTINTVFLPEYSRFEEAEYNS